MITGQTKLFGILADPVGHVRTPEVMNAYFASHGADAVLVPLHVKADDLEAVWGGLRRLRNLGGLVVTLPHKSAILALCDHVGAAARQVGAANAVRRDADGRMHCDMFDGRGFVEGLLRQGYDPAGRRVLLVGAGGAASAIAFALAAQGCVGLTIANRTAAKAEALAAKVKQPFPACDVRAGPAEPGNHELIINATSLGLRADDPLPLAADKLTPEMIVAEVIMKPETTALLARAAQCGCSLHHGRHMLDAQVRLLADFIGAVPMAKAQREAAIAGPTR
ncbi:MAG: shikimate dehydrogenase family protein [Kiloniellales bacterium]